MLHSTKLINKIIITLMALLLLFNTNYGAFKTSEAHANVLTATFEEWAAATFATVATGTVAVAAGAMHTQEYLLDSADEIYKTAKESWKTMAPDMKANFLSSVEKMEDGIITVGDWITGALDALKPKFGDGTAPSVGQFLERTGGGMPYSYKLTGGYSLRFADGYTASGHHIVRDLYDSGSLHIQFYFNMSSGSYFTEFFSYKDSAGKAKAVFNQVESINSPWALASLLNSVGTNSKMFPVTVLKDGVAVPMPNDNTYNRLDEWIRERAIPNGQLGVYNPGAQAYTSDGYRLGLSTDGQTLLKLPDGIPWEGTADWKQPLLNTVDGTTAVLDTAVGSWIDVTTGKKIRDATVTEMVSGTGVDESTAEYVLIKAKDEEKAREEKDKETGEYAGKPYEGERNPNADFKNSKGKSTLDKHADKHGYVSSEKYLQNARNFLEKTPTSTTQTFVSKEGTYFRYDTATNEFGIINKYGGISTYFKPEDKIVYWLKQIELYAPK